MEQQKHSQFDLLKGKLNFSNEPNWFKLVVIAMMLAFFLCLAYIVVHGSPSFIAGISIGGAIGKIISLIKGSPP